eukprot:TRINITY_DN6481_c0_g1_i1.p1 TRINITY_DN6481_c0_g1~~TRINITY_DN6481_c0_g1_i1.p1  ORF type:complete len:275 (-),score=53.57 TRINITY_DN6481_c0_g1_i1:55-879(-)
MTNGGIVALSALLILVIAISGITMPRASYVQQHSHSGNAIAGGVLLAAGLVHMLGDASGDLQAAGESLEGAMGGDPADGFPLAQTLAGFTFITMWLLEIIGPKPHKTEVSEVSDAAADVEAQAKQVCQKKTTSSAVTLLLALCIHSVLAGIGLGLSEGGAFTGVFIAIALHKFFAAFALGSALLQCEMSRQLRWAAIVVFSLSTPAGMLLAQLISKYAEGAGEGIFKALAAGTFFYVSIIEMLLPSLSSPKNQITKWALSVVGFLGFSSLAAWV